MGAAATALRASASAAILKGEKYMQMRQKGTGKGKVSRANVTSHISGSFSASVFWALKSIVHRQRLMRHSTFWLFA